MVKVKQITQSPKNTKARIATYILISLTKPCSNILSLANFITSKSLIL